jgi:hypothetical protein
MIYVVFFFGDRMAASVPSRYFQGDLAPDLQMVLCELHRLSGSEEFQGGSMEIPQELDDFSWKITIFGWKPHGNQLFKAQLDISQPVKGNQ